MKLSPVAPKDRVHPGVSATPTPLPSSSANWGKHEDAIGDLLIMANIAARAACGEERGEQIFTANHLRDMIDEFRQSWYDSHKEANGGGVDD
jgi:hypothetical protein